MPIFSIWIAGQVMRGLQSTYGSAGLAGQEAVSNQKAKILYCILDGHPDLYVPVNDKSVRSRMNICFRFNDAAIEKEFIGGAEQRLLQGLKGRTYAPPRYLPPLRLSLVSSPFRTNPSFETQNQVQCLATRILTS